MRSPLAPAAELIDTDRHPLADPSFVSTCAATLQTDGALVLEQFLTDAAVARALAEADGREAEAFYAASTHNVWLTPPDPELPADHIFNRQIVSTKGLLADDQLAADSVLRQLYDLPAFRSFLATVLGVDELHPYADALSSINVHFHRDGEELGWHFDNSEFAVTLLLQAPDAGGHFDFVPQLRNAECDDQNYSGVEAAVDGHRLAQRLAFNPGALVLFRGRNALHRVTPSRGNTTRILVVLAFNTEAGIALSDSAKATFYGRMTASPPTGVSADAETSPGRD